MWFILVGVSTCFRRVVEATLCVVCSTLTWPPGVSRRRRTTTAQLPQLLLQLQHLPTHLSALVATRYPSCRQKLDLPFRLRSTSEEVIYMYMYIVVLRSTTMLMSSSVAVPPPIRTRSPSPPPPPIAAQLLEMGFSLPHIKKALSTTGCALHCKHQFDVFVESIVT